MSDRALNWSIGKEVAVASGANIQNQLVRLSTARLLILCMCAIFLIETAYAMLILVYLQLNPPVDFGKTFILALWAIHTVKFVILAYFIGRIIARNLSRSIWIVGQNLIYTTGMVRDKDKIYGLAQLKSIAVEQGVVGKMFHYGNIRLMFGASGYTETVILDGVHEPRRYEEMLDIYLEREIQTRIDRTK